MQNGATNSQKLKEIEWEKKYVKDIYDRFIQKTKNVIIARLSEDKKLAFRDHSKFELTNDG